MSKGRKAGKLAKLCLLMMWLQTIALLPTSFNKKRLAVRPISFDEWESYGVVGRDDLLGTRSNRRSLLLVMMDGRFPLDNPLSPLLCLKENSLRCENIYTTLCGA